MEAAVVSKLTWRLLPFLFLLYIVAYLDRSNVGFAGLQMQQQLGLTDAVFGLGLGMFFVGYFFFQVPSNLALERVGARRWIATLMVIWGVISGAMVLVEGAKSFYALRFLLGAAEAGFFPGVIFYLKNWFPAQARARTVARFMTAAPLSAVIGGPVSGALLGMHLKAMAGWQWMFLMEALPAVVLGGVALVYLVDRPEEARWLSAEERDWLLGALRREREENAAPVDPGNSHPLAENARRVGRLHPDGAFGALKMGNVWMLAAVYFGLNTVSYGVGLWLPKIIHSVWAGNTLGIGFLTAIPSVAAALAMVVVGLHSDRSGERRWHTAVPALTGAMALAAAAFSTSIGPTIVLISITVLCVFSMMGPFWAMPTSFLSGVAAAAGIAFINSIGNLGGFAGSYVIGLVRTSTGGFKGGLLLVSGALALAGVVALMVRPGSRAYSGNPAR